MKTVIICKDRGLFLGTDVNRREIFANVDSYGSYKAPTFKSHDDARNYNQKYMLENQDHEFVFLNVNTESNYVSVVEIIKLGYGKFTGDCIVNLPNYVEVVQ